jgi:hypothetical protein
MTHLKIFTQILVKKLEGQRAIVRHGRWVKGGGGGSSSSSSVVTLTTTTIVKVSINVHV